MHRLTSLTALLVVSAVAALAQEPRLPAFSAGDQLAMAGALCGEVSRGTVNDDIGGKPEAVKGFVAADKHSICIELLSVSYTERGAAKHIIVFGDHSVDDDGVLDSSQGARTTLHAGLLEHRGGKWTATLKQSELAETGFNGRDPAVTLRTIGQDRHGFEVVQQLWNAGSSAESLSLFEATTNEFAEILSVGTGADDCGQQEKCFTFESTLSYDTASNAPAFDIKLALTGTYRNRAGRIVNVPAAPFVLRFDARKYVPVLTTPAMREVWEATQKPW